MMLRQRPSRTSIVLWRMKVYVLLLICTYPVSESLFGAAYFYILFVSKWKCTPPYNLLFYWIWKFSFSLCWTVFLVTWPPVKISYSEFMAPLATTGLSISVQSIPVLHFLLKCKWFAGESPFPFNSYLDMQKQIVAGQWFWVVWKGYLSGAG